MLQYKTYKNPKDPSFNDDINTLDNEEIVSLSYAISDAFAVLMYRQMVSLIKHIKARGTPALSLGGYAVTFRTVVKDEVWT